MSTLCGVPEDLVKGINNLWIAIRTSRQIDAQKFDILAKQVKKIYTDSGLNWYPMNPSGTIHK